MAVHTVDTQLRLLRLPEAAARLDVSVETLRRRIAAGDIAAVRLGPSDRYPLRISEDALASFLGSSPPPPEGDRTPSEVRRVPPGQSTAPAHGGAAA